MERIIFHIDVNSAFLSWEAVHLLHHRGFEPDLREVPSAVGGDRALRRGIILAKSIPAKRCGIHTGEAIFQAKQKCPGLLLVPPDYHLYERCSEAFIRILRDYSELVEQYSVDEAFVDMTGTCHLFGTPVQAAQQIKERIREELGFTVNIGVSENKLLAKMASDFLKPDRVHTLFRDEIPEKLWPLPVSELFFVGRATAKKLFSVGIRTVKELAAAEPAFLRSLLKKHGEVIWGFANGIDCSGVQTVPPANKGYGNSTTTPSDLSEPQAAETVLLALAETVAARLRADGVSAGLVSLGIRYSDFSFRSHQRVLQNATNLTREIYEAACGLFAELWDGRPLRHLGIHTGRVCGSAERQLSLFDAADYEKLACAERAADAIRRRFGQRAVMRAALLKGGGLL